MPGSDGRAIQEVPVLERPRERLAIRGASGLTAAELIGLVWGSGRAGDQLWTWPRMRWPAMTG